MSSWEAAGYGCLTQECCSKLIVLVCDACTGCVSKLCQYAQQMSKWQLRAAGLASSLLEPKQQHLASTQWCSVSRRQLAWHPEAAVPCSLLQPPRLNVQHPVYPHGRDLSNALGLHAKRPSSTSQHPSSTSRQEFYMEALLIIKPLNGSYALLAIKKWDT